MFSIVFLKGLTGVRLICGTADRGTKEPVELAEPTEPKRNDCFITIAFSKSDEIISYNQL